MSSDSMPGDQIPVDSHCLPPNSTLTEQLVSERDTLIEAQLLHPQLCGLDRDIGTISQTHSKS